MTFTDTLPTPAAAGPGPLAIDLRGLHKSFGTVHAVDGIDLAVTPGEVVAFLGPNGAGKTTTIDLLLGLAEPDAGSVQVLGLDPGRAIADGRVSAVMQSGGLLRDLTVAETVELTASFFRSARSTATCWRARASRTSPTARWASAPADSSSGCGSRSRCCRTPT